MTVPLPNFAKKVVDTIGTELAVTAGLAGVLSLWQLPITLLLPITVVWLMTLVSLSYLNQVAGSRPRGSRVAVVVLMSSALVVTAFALGMSLFRNPEAVKRIEVEITSAIRDMKVAEVHSIDCSGCPANWRSESHLVLLTSAPILRERKTVTLAPFVIEMSSNKTVSIVFWGLAGIYMIITVFIGFGSVIATLSSNVSVDTSTPPQPPKGEKI